MQVKADINLYELREAHSCLSTIPPFPKHVSLKQNVSHFPSTLFWPRNSILLPQVLILDPPVLDYQLVFILNVVTSQLNRNQLHLETGLLMIGLQLLPLANSHSLFGCSESRNPKGKVQHPLPRAPQGNYLPHPALQEVGMGCSVHSLGLGANWAITRASCCDSVKPFLIQDRLSYQKVRLISLKKGKTPSPAFLCALGQLECILLSTQTLSTAWGSGAKSPWDVPPWHADRLCLADSNENPTNSGRVVFVCVCLLPPPSCLKRFRHTNLL